MQRSNPPLDGLMRLAELLLAGAVQTDRVAREREAQAMPQHDAQPGAADRPAIRPATARRMRKAASSERGDN